MSSWAVPEKSAAWSRTEFIVTGILSIALVVFGT
ncbi:unnamed protein product, partial [Didymodactylos carnosus]